MKIKENYNFSLINGEFEPTEVSPLVSELYNAKIEHHNRKALKLKMKNNNYKDEEDRVSQLEHECKAFQKMMQEANEHGYDVIVKGDINVQLIKKESR